MKVELFNTFPCLRNYKIGIRKMEEQDVGVLAEITNYDNVINYGE